MMRVLLILFIVVFQFRITIAQGLEKDKHYFISAIGFWNVENLYDTLNDVWKNDEEFTPQGKNTWTGPRYKKKIEHLAEAISKMAIDINSDGLAILGLCEIENKQVVQDLINSEKLVKRKYQFIHIDGPDARGVDPSFIYNPNYFKPTKALAYRVKLVSDSTHKTRDILVISGVFDGEPLSVLVNHWPSRRGGEMSSRPNRNAAAKITRHIADSISKQNPNCKIVIMGDFNDDPINESIRTILGTYCSIYKPRKGKFFNPMEQLYEQGIGSLAWQDSWNLFDQIILNKEWLALDYLSWQFYKVQVFNKAFLKSDFGNFKGYPFRTYSGGSYSGGYSDHFPVYIVIAKEKRS